MHSHAGLAWAPHKQLNIDSDLRQNNKYRRRN